MLKNFSFFQKILAGISVFLLIAIALTTAAAFALKKADFAAGLRRADPALAESAKSDKRFLSLHKMRLATADSPPVIVILSPYFRYESGNDAFSDELEQKKRRISAVISEYFRIRTRKELANLGEMQIKDEILALSNAEVVLGELKNLYFEEFLFIE